MIDPKTIDPTDPVAVLRAAARELEIRRDDPRFVIDMDQYHDASTIPCRICLAGAMVCGLAGDDQFSELRLVSFGKDWERALIGLDHFRKGEGDWFFNFICYDFDTIKQDHERFSNKWDFVGELSPQEIDELISHCLTVADWLEDQERKKQ